LQVKSPRSLRMYRGVFRLRRWHSPVRSGRDRS